MKNPLRLLAGSLLAALSVAAAPAQLDWPEPSYGGKTTGAWLDEYGAGPAGYKPKPEADDALRHIGVSAAPRLLELLHATNSNPAAKIPASWDHWKAYLGFQALGPLGKAAIPDLVKLAHDPSSNSKVPYIGFWKDTARVAEIADESVTYDAPDQPHKPRGMIALSGAFLVDGEIAAWSLAAIGADSVPPLMEMLTNPIPRLRCRAAVALGLIGAAAEPSVPALVRILDDTDSDKRAEALDDPDTRRNAMDALGCIGRRADLAVPALTKALTDPDRGMQWIAVVSLGDFGERATNAIPGLVAVFLFPPDDYTVKEEAALALSKISPETTAKQIVPRLLQDLKDSNGAIRNDAVETLGEMKGQADLVIPGLIGALDYAKQDDNNAIEYLASFGPAAKAALPKLRSLTNDPDPELRAEAIRALQQIDPGPPPPR
jgi:HEAT repeat protein